MTFTLVKLRFYLSEEFRYCVAALNVTSILLQFAYSFPYEQALHTRTGIYYINLIPHVIIQANAYGTVLHDDFNMSILPVFSSLIATMSTISSCSATPIPSQNRFVNVISSLPFQWGLTGISTLLNIHNVLDLATMLRAEIENWFRD
jgi:hypothetical protein